MTGSSAGTAPRQRMKDSTAAVARLLRARGGDGLSDAEAHAELGIDRLAARVWELVHWHGWTVSKVMERAPNGTRYARYYRESEPAATTVPTRGVQEALFA